MLTEHTLGNSSLDLERKKEIENTFNVLFSMSQKRD